VGTSSIVRGVGRRGGSDTWEDDRITDDDDDDDDEEGGRRGIDFSIARVRPRSACTRARTWSRRVMAATGWRVCGVNEICAISFPYRYYERFK